MRADTAGSAEMVSITKDKTKAAIASSLSAETYNLEIIKDPITDFKEGVVIRLVSADRAKQIAGV